MPPNYPPEDTDAEPSAKLDSANEVTNPPNFADGAKGEVNIKEKWVLLTIIFAHYYITNIPRFGEDGKISVILNGIYEPTEKNLEGLPAILTSPSQTSLLRNLRVNIRKCIKSENEIVNGNFELKVSSPNYWTITIDCQR